MEIQEQAVQLGIRTVILTVLNGGWLCSPLYTIHEYSAIAVEEDPLLEIQIEEKQMVKPVKGKMPQTKKQI